jgi:predicted dehydrogenase
LIPALKKAGAELRTVASRGGVSAVHAGRKFGFQETTTDTDHVFSDPSVDVVVVATRHDTHAHLVRRALDAGKHVFVEKPLALTLSELGDIERAREEAVQRSNVPLVMVGFNRRFAPQIVLMKKLLAAVSEPKALVMTVNAGAIPAEHWTQDPNVGGGRIIGEACHFIDLMRFLVGSPVRDFGAVAMGGASGSAVTQDRASITLCFADGSIGTIHYLTNGHRSFPKERLEVFGGGKVLQLDNFRRLSGYGWKGFSRMNLWRQDKGQDACAAAFVRAVASGGRAPIPFDEVVEVARVTIEVAEALR